MEAFVADLGRVLDGAGAERAVVGGLSLGAAVALRFAQVQPGRVRGLVLASFPPGRAPGEVASARALAFAESIEKDGMEAAGARFVWGPESGLDPRGAALVRQGFLEHPPHALAHVLRELLAVLPPVGEQAAILASLKLPVLIVAGAEDLAAVAATRTLAAERSDARVEVIEGAGHVVNMARPGAVNASLLAFLDSLA
jgi:pimeloyl-ACP methyl ester carboxylesterase